MSTQRSTAGVEGLATTDQEGSNRTDIPSCYGTDESGEDRTARRSSQPCELDLCGPTRGLNRVTLPRVAAEFSENVYEVEPLDTLGNDAQAKGVTEVDDRADEVLIFPVRVTELEARCERTIQLDFANREVAQMGERREPGTEVIDRHHDSRVRQTLNDPLGSRQVGHDHPLRDL